MARRILIFSPPSCGNRLLREGLSRCNTGGIVQYDHGSIGYKREGHREKFALNKDPKKTFDCVVVLVRSPRAWSLSCARRWWNDWLRDSSRLWMGKSTAGDVWAAQYGEIFRLSVEAGLPIYPVSYEALVEDPNGVLATLCDFLGLEFVPWPTHPPEGVNMKKDGESQRGPVINGNRKYLDEGSVWMVGPADDGDSLIEVDVPKSAVSQYERRGFWRKDKLPKASAAPAEAVAADTRRGQ